MHRLILILPLLALGACQANMGEDRPGTWRSTDVNGANLQAMRVPPAAQARPMPAERAARPVLELIAGQRPALPDAGRIRGGAGLNASR